jgi:hypothetical protein
MLLWMHLWMHLWVCLRINLIIGLLLNICIWIISTMDGIILLNVRFFTLFWNLRSSFLSLLIKILLFNLSTLFIFISKCLIHRALISLIFTNFSIFYFNLCPSCSCLIFFWTDPLISIFQSFLTAWSIKFPLTLSCTDSSLL